MSFGKGLPLLSIKDVGLLLYEVYAYATKLECCGPNLHMY